MAHTAVSDRSATRDEAHAWPSHVLWTRVATLGLAALIAYLALTPLPPFAADVFGSLVRRHVILGAVMLGYLAWLIARRRLPGATPLDLPLAAVTLALLLATWRSANPRVSAEAVLPLLPALVLFYLIHDVEDLDAHALAWAAVLAGGLVALFALAAVWRALDDWWTLVRAVEGGVGRDAFLPPSMPRVTGVGNHPNVLAAVFAMALPPALFLWVSTPSRRQRTIVALAAALCITALFFTLSRGAWIGAAAGIATTAVGFILAARRRLRPSRGMVAGLALLVVVGLALFAAVVVSRTRPDWLFRESLSPRADLRRAGWEMFLDKPLTGVGPGLFTSLYPLYDGAYPFAAVHTHNIVVQTAVDTGIVGLLAGAYLAVVVVALVVRGFRDGSADRRFAVATAAGMLVAAGTHALVDSPHLFPEVQLLCVVALVILTRDLTPQPPSLKGRGSVERALPPLPFREGGWGVRSEGGWAARLLPMLLAAVLPLAWFGTDRAHHASAQGIAAAHREDWPAAVAAFQRAVDRDDRMPAYWFQLGAAHASAAIAGERAAEQRAALVALQRGLDLEPHNGAALVNFAALNVALERPTAARATLPALARLSGRDSLLLLAHATLTQWTMPPEEAIETYAGLLVLNPTLAATPFWQADGFRSANFQRIVDRALARVPEVAGSGPAADSLRTAIQVYAGREAPSLSSIEAALAARPDDPGLRVAAGRLLMTAEPTRPRAFELLDSAVRLKGDDPAAHAALGDWYAQAGDQRRARREWLTAAALGDPGAAVALGASYPPDAVPPPVLKRAKQLVQDVELARFYLIFQTFRFTFQRAEPVPIILPGDWLAALPRELPQWQAAVESWRAP